MSRLSDVIGHVVEVGTDGFGRLDVHSAVALAVEMIDDEDRNTLVEEALGKRIKDAATKAKRAAANAASSQGALFADVRRAHALDTDGRIVKLTDEMTELEFKRVIEIRRKQIADDIAYLDVLEHAYLQVQPVWRAHPDETFGEVCRRFAESAAA